MQTQSRNKCTSAKFRNSESHFKTCDLEICQTFSIYQNIPFFSDHLFIMIETIAKIRAMASTDEALIEKIKNKVFAIYRISRLKHANMFQTDCDDCEFITWIPLSKTIRIDSSNNTIILVVDIVQNQNAVRIFENQKNTFVNDIETKNAEFIMIISWNTEWWLRISNSLWMNYIIDKDVS